MTKEDVIREKDEEIQRLRTLLYECRKARVDDIAKFEAAVNDAVSQLSEMASVLRALAGV